jgi:hypothetical protein
MTFNPVNDGVDHIWLSPKGRTFLGQQLGIGAHRPFVDPEYGRFESIYAFWLWYESNRVDVLRNVHHRNMILSSITGLSDLPGSRAEVALVAKRSILNDPTMLREMRGSELPFACYEVINFTDRDPESTIYPLPDREWYVRALEEVRLEIKAM